MSHTWRDLAELMLKLNTKLDLWLLGIWVILFIYMHANIPISWAASILVYLSKVMHDAGDHLSSLQCLLD